MLDWKKVSVKRLATVVIASLLLSSSQVAASGVDVSSYQKIEEVKQIIDQYHLEQVEEKDIIDDAIDGIVNGLDDPYASYYSQKDAEQITQLFEEGYVDSGLVLHDDLDGNVIVIDTLENSASDGKLELGDIITKIDVEDITAYGAVYAAYWLSGSDGDEITVTVLRNGEEREIKLTLTPYDFSSIESTMIHDIGYIKMKQFSEDADESFKQHLDRLKEQGMEKLVFDLRNNPGGFVDTAMNIVKNFMDKAVVMYTTDASGITIPATIIDGKNADFPVVILVNEESASASELLTGALQDHEVATVVGNWTYGKARIQQYFPLSDGSVFGLTIQHYLTPNKRDINYIGLLPDVYVYEEIPQFITALHTAGVKQMELKRTPYGVEVNGHDLQATFNMVENEGTIYIPYTILGALMNAEIVYDYEKETVQFIQGEQSTIYDMNSEVFQAYNETYFIDVAVVQQTFPQLQWSNKDGELHLKY
ncbi:S41 family peptidase [Longirhabdus pacifica]|uniref:S41 family peptidase n=1 Tax=Longirhabdus pacifica TaxID=2305227 RepID=UPI0010087A4B|nr:S41 family peptidase [Longirhabdus pacifica]